MQKPFHLSLFLIAIAITFSYANQTILAQEAEDLAEIEDIKGEVSETDSDTEDQDEGMYVSAPFCFKYGGPLKPPIVVPKVTTCNGGVIFSPLGPVPTPDCGPRGAACEPPIGAPTGCLNLICAAHNNALWDPVTKTCGCG